jgi:hypothetical protein
MLPTKVRGRLYLPEPDSFGTYYLGRDHKDGPVIFPSKYRAKGSALKIIVRPTFIALVDVERGFLWDGPKLKQFKSAGEALDAIVEATSKGLK